MKKLIILFIVLIATSCSGKKDDPAPVPTSNTNYNTNCGYHNGKKLYLGSEGGCYYYSSGGNKEYVSRGECSCSVN